MPLDKSRIQGFGSECPGASPIKVVHCPAGHTLQVWTARSGRCDGCGRGIRAGEQVMDCRQCNWYLCDTCHPLNQGDGSSFWGQISSLTDQMASPAVQSALDSVALRFGDVIDAATQDMSEMATEVKTFVSSSLGLQDSDDEGPRPFERDRKPKEPDVSPRQRAESTQIVADFCEKYPAARVIPNEDELERLWARCSVLNPAPIASALYDQLSWSDGDGSWQSRLRVLYAIEHLHHKGGVGKEIASTVMQNASGLIQHLTEVSQCREKAAQVLYNILGKVTEGQEPAKEPKKIEKGHAGGHLADGEGEAKAKVSAKASTQPAHDLLDLVVPKSVPVVVKQAGGPMDLMSVDTQPAAAGTGLQDLNLLDGSMPSVLLPVSDLRPAATVSASTREPKQDFFLLDMTTSSSSTTTASAEQKFDPHKPACSGLPAMMFGNGPSMSATKPSALGVVPPISGASQTGNLGNPLGFGQGSLAFGQTMPGQGSRGFGALGQAAAPFSGPALGRAPPVAGSNQQALTSNGFTPMRGNTMGGLPMGTAAYGVTKPMVPLPSDAAASLQQGGQDPFSFVAAHTGIGDEKK